MPVPVIVFTKKISVELLGDLILDDIDKYFDTLSVVELDIIQKRWGFVEEKKTLVEIGKEHAVTRERIRQVEQRVNKNMPRYLRFSQEFIWQILQPALSIELKQKLQNLFSCFDSEKDFYEVLGLLSGQKNLEKYIRPPIKPYILDNYFSENGGPISLEAVKEYLVECEFENIKDVGNAIRYLELEERVRIDGEKVWPLNLSKSHATAFVLANNPNGLPWMDIAIHVNTGNYSRNKMAVDRLDGSTMQNTKNN